MPNEEGKKAQPITPLGHNVNVWSTTRGHPGVAETNIPLKADISYGIKNVGGV